MASLESLIGAVAARSGVDAAVAVLVETLAERIKATSNDQNIQRLARELKALGPALAAAVAAKEVAKPAAKVDA